MNYVIGIDLGTSAVKALLMDQNGKIVTEAAASYPLIQEKAGYSEQDPEQWVIQTKQVVRELVEKLPESPTTIKGISFSGQMHGLVMLDNQHEVIRNAILWNDTRTTKQCAYLTEQYGEEILRITKNRVLEGFTLPKLLWVRENEQENFQKLHVFLLPKDYVRFRMTGNIHMDYSDAAGTSLLDIEHGVWSEAICHKVGLDKAVCPPLVDSHAYVGDIHPDIAEETGLSPQTKVFAGGADNACGAIGAGILSSEYALASIGTSGVMLAYEESATQQTDGTVHFFNHAKKDAYYSMGVTLSAGQSLSWFKQQFAGQLSFTEIVDRIGHIPVGADGLLFTPYLFGERTPHADAMIRGSFIGVSAVHTLDHFVRAVMEGITFSLNESLEILRQKGKQIRTIISIGGGAKNDHWLQMQADIFNTEVVSLQSEQGPGLGAAILAAYGCGWFSSLEEGAKQCLSFQQTFYPQQNRVEKYQDLFPIYQKIYEQTKGINKELMQFRQKN